VEGGAARTVAPSQLSRVRGIHPVPATHVWARTHTGGWRRDEGIDGIGLAPISPVLSSRVAVQAKRYDPTVTIGRDVVALFQRDAAAAGAERAVLVTLARFSPPARKAATVTTPTVDLIDGDKLCALMRDQKVGLRIVPQVDERWFDRFDT
jgi:restriction system protein